MLEPLTCQSLRDKNCSKFLLWGQDHTSQLGLGAMKISQILNFVKRKTNIDKKNKKGFPKQSLIYALVISLRQTIKAN